ncbi:MAG: LysR family transcriptional regulator [Granulosicoccus sp.]
MDRRLRQFLAVAETGNVTTAAEMLHISQPTVSVNMRRLEEDHGVQFFKRSSRGVQLTEFGKVLYEHAKVMARLDDHAAAQIQMLKASDQKAMRLGTGFAWWSIFMRDILSSYQHEHPGGSMHVDVCSSLDGLRYLLSGDIDCFVGTKVEKLNDNAGFYFEHLFSVEDAFFARKDHPLMGTQTHLADVAHFPKLDVAPFVNRHMGLIERDDFDPMFVARSLAQTGFLTTNSMTTGVDLLRDTDAILVYPIVCDTFFQKHGIHELNVIDGSRKKIKIGIYSLAEKEPDGQLALLLDQIKLATKGLKLQVNMDKKT